MRLSHAHLAAVITTCAFLAQPALAAGGGKAEKGPAGIPFSCSDGREMRVVSDGAGPRGKLKLLFADGHPHELRAQPTIEGLRYAGEADGHMLVWSTDGIEGVLAQASADAAEEQEIARCRRAGWDGFKEGAAGHHGEDTADHTEESH